MKNRVSSGEVAVHRGKQESRYKVCCRFLRFPQAISPMMKSCGCTMTSPDETLFFIERHGLMGRGIGYIDASVLASAVLVQVNLWSRDKRLMALATELGCAYSSDPST